MYIQLTDKDLYTISKQMKEQKDQEIILQHNKARSGSVYKLISKIMSHNSIRLFFQYEEAYDPFKR